MGAHKRLFGTNVYAANCNHTTSGSGIQQYIANVSTFWMDAFEVSNARYSQYLQAVSHKTIAEQRGLSMVPLFAVPFSRRPSAARSKLAKNGSYTGRKDELFSSIQNASWERPEGTKAISEGIDPASCTANSTHGNGTCFSKLGIPLVPRWNFPVVHITADEAADFCAWAGGHLPEEEQWEAAAGGMHHNMTFPWGSKLVHNDTHRSNVWQGQYPVSTRVRDGFKLHAPIDAYGPQNELGFYNMIGNVAEWTETRACNVSGIMLRRSPLPPKCVKDLREAAMASSLFHSAGKQKAASSPDAERFTAFVELGDGKVSLPRDLVLKGHPLAKGGSFVSHSTSDAAARIQARVPYADEVTAYTIGFRCAYHVPIEDAKSCSSSSSLLDGCVNVRNDNLVPPVYALPETYKLIMPSGSAPEQGARVSEGGGPDQEEPRQEL